MRRIGLAVILAIFLAQPAAADVIIPGPPLIPIKLSQAKVAKMRKAARVAVENIFEFSKGEGPEYLNEAYRAAGKQEIQALNRVRSVVVLGDRAFVLAETNKWLAPQTIGPVYTYFQCRFDDEGQVIGIDVMP